MSDLLEKIKEEHQDVAEGLQEAGLRSDSDIRSLTGGELHQLLPEQKDLKLRRTIFDIIHKQSVGQLEMKDISGDFKDALTDNGVLDDNLPFLKEMQTHMKYMQSFLDGRICSLANIQNQPNQKSVTNVTKPRDDHCPEGAHGEVMSDLLEKIKEEHQDVAKVLQEAGLRSDSDIRSLTREQLLELFPGTNNFKLRRRIFEIIQNQKPVKQPPPTGVNNGIPSRGSSDDTMDISDQQPRLKSEVMSDLLEKIKEEHQDVAKVLQEADLCSDSDIRSLTQEELNQLFPGPKYLKLRRRIFEMIQNQKPVLFQKPIAVIHPRVVNKGNPSRGSSDDRKDTSDQQPRLKSEVMSDLLEKIKEEHRDVAKVLQEADLYSDSDIWSLTQEELNQLFPVPKNLKLRRRIFEMIQNQKPVKQPPPTGVNNGNPSRGSSVDRMDTSDQQTRLKKEPSKVVNKRKGKLMYQMVVTGTTFDAHDQLTEKVKNEVKDQFDLVQSNSNDYDVTIVFCPIVSRMGRDVESAMRDVKGDKPVILVLMHHAYETKFIPNVQQGANVQLQVNVFFHETKHGLLHCRENGAVVCEITKYLKEIPIPNAQVVAAAHSGYYDSMLASFWGHFTSKDKFA